MLRSPRLARFFSSRALPPFSRGLVAAGAAIVSLIDPARADMVALLGDSTGTHALRRLRDSMARTPDGAWLLAHRPRVRGPRFEAAALQRAHSPDSLGGALGAFLLAHEFDAEERAPVRFVEDEELAYVLTRYREVHDMWHVLSGLPPTVLGEVALKWFEMVQTGLPVAALSALAGPLRLSPADARVLARDLLPWAVDAGARAVPLLSVRYEDLLDESLEAVRAKLRFPAAPRG
jgi:ubiquinone biosynthesis protein COQ4